MTDSDGSGSDTRRAPPEVRSPVSRSSHAHLDDARFLPGSVLAGRYRIIGRLGSGGMGEVYRADDLKLGTPVALMFLPEDIQGDADRLERLLGEVRIAREISHPNICRVYDVGEVDGLHFFSMEYIDGEDLASLLRRIGRLPEEKALQIARQLCAGLGAAHEKDVLHRDLKPANVMIDGRGRARITDFGLAALASQVGGREIRSGTPAYMAPEQLRGESVTKQSDVYALGLVLYELFTGRQAHSSSAEDRDSQPSSPSSHVSGLDGAVEHAILRCLEPRPGDRPASALAVAAALPGGDPLAAALAAGETPSPELVAETDRGGVLRPAVAALLLGGCVAAAVAVAWLGPRSQVSGLSGLDLAPAVLENRARQILADQGWTVERRDSTWGWIYSADHVDWAEEQAERSESFWVRVDPPELLHFWYREGDRYLESLSPVNFLTAFNDPPLGQGMARVVLRSDGRLVSFEAVRHEPESESTDAALDWGPLFEAAELDPGDLQPTQPLAAPGIYVDRRFAWESRTPADAELRIEAATLNGRPASFLVESGWRHTPATNLSEATRTMVGGSAALLLAMMTGLVVLGAIMARRNQRLQRADALAARRAGIGYGGLSLVVVLFTIHHVPTSGWWINSVLLIGFGLANGALVWGAYLALEPYLRRSWPEVLVSWVRAIRGQLDDPMVGRDLLLGCLGGLTMRLLGQVSFVGLGHRGLDSIWFGETLALANSRQFVGVSADALQTSFGVMVLAIVLPAISRITGARRWPAAVAFLAVVTAVLMPDLGHLSATVPAAALITFLLLRFGLLAASVSYGVIGLTRFPLTLDFEAWYVGRSLFVLAIILGAAGYGFHMARAREPMRREGYET